MPTPAYMTINGEKQGLITAGTFTEASVVITSYSIHYTKLYEICISTFSTRTSLTPIISTTFPTASAPLARPC